MNKRRKLTQLLHYTTFTVASSVPTDRAEHTVIGFSIYLDAGITLLIISMIRERLRNLKRQSRRLRSNEKVGGIHTVSVGFRLIESVL